MAVTETSVTSDYGTDIPPVTTPSKGGQHIDGRALFIGAMVCGAVGGLLLIAAIVRLALYAHRLRSDKYKRKKRRRQLEHMKYLEEYSIRTGDSPNKYISQPEGGKTELVDKNQNTHVFDWDEYGVNPAFISDDTLKKHSPKIKLDAHITGSAKNGPSSSRKNSRAGSTDSSNALISPQVSVTSQESALVNGEAGGLHNRSLDTVDTSVTIDTDNNTPSTSGREVTAAGDDKF